MKIYEINYTSFAYTVKVLRKPKDATEETYETWFKHAIDSHAIIISRFPEVTSGILHYHGILMLSKNYFRRRLIVHGFHMKLDKLYNKKRWLKYCCKQCVEKMPKLF